MGGSRREALDRLAQGGESFDFAQDREPVERRVESFCISIFVFSMASLLSPRIGRTSPGLPL
jgi:hypothetical protein